MSTFAGRFTLLQKLAAGGMAEVFLARQHGIEGFEKLVVLKRILPHHSDNPEFVRMFLDEARTAADLSHPNVVDIYDAGLFEGAYFITMEYLRGKDLGAVFAEARRAGTPLPLESALRIVIDAARGLHAAHTSTAADGRRLAIVHRDISPQNLFTTWDGITKVLDFGIAHAADRSTRTDSGIVKGKLAYLSPEQLEGFELDGRSDQFALGIVAWELLTLERLFHKPSDAETLRAILEHRVPRPSSVRPVPEAVEALVLRMLAHERRERFPDCATLADALEAWLDEQGLAHSPRKVRTALRTLFPERPRTPTREVPAVKAPAEPTADHVVKKDVTTRSERRRPALREEEDFLAALSSWFDDGQRRRRSNLVPPSGPFVGREGDLESLAAYLGEGARVVTVVGFGGMGKTRLAQEFAWRQREAWASAGGAWFVDLSKAFSVDEVCKAVGRALDVVVPVDASSDVAVVHTGRTLQALGRALVVLDNFEQVAQFAAQTVGRWRELAPEVRFVVTSRESLRVPGESVHPLGPLSVGPDSEAVQLFLARAAAAGLARPVPAAELSYVVEICRKLEGHTLAIQLAAALVPQLPPRALLERLQQSFDVLGGADPSKGRHGTLRNAIEWSWQLLSPAEQLAFAQLSVFRGGFTPESAEAVLELSSVPGAPRPFPALEALHRKSLLTHFASPDTPRELRLTMLESLAEFAAERLEALGGVAAARERHARHFLALGHDWLDALTTARADEAMGHLFAEYQNLSEVFERALATLPPTRASAATVLAALQVVEPVMLRRGPYASHLALLDEALRLGEGVGLEPARLSAGYQQRGNAWRVRGRLAHAVADLEAGLKLAQDSGDERLVGRAAGALAVARFVSGSLEPALDGLLEALRLSRAHQDHATTIEALSFLAIVRVARDELPLAVECCDEALPLARARGDRLNEARVLGSMGSMYLGSGQLDLAQAYLSDAVERCRRIHEVRLEGYFLGKLSHVMAERGRRDVARERLQQALAMLSDVGDLRHEGLFLTYLATMESQAGRHDAARTALGSARIRLETVRDPLLLSALTVRSMDVEVRALAASRADGLALLDDVRTPRASLPPRVRQSEEVRLAAAILQRTLAEPRDGRPGGA
jgi:serine/threonine protein kinase/predicted ATPase